MQWTRTGSTPPLKAGGGVTKKQTVSSRRANGEDELACVSSKRGCLFHLSVRKGWEPLDCPRDGLFFLSLYGVPTGSRDLESCLPSPLSSL